MNLKENIQRIKQMINYNNSDLPLLESINVNIDKILGRQFKLDLTEEPYKFQIEDKNKNLVKMRIKAPNGNFINIVDVDHVVEDFGDGSKKLVGYNFKGKSGTVKLIEAQNVKKILDFVDDPERKSLTISLVTFEKI
jgi:hypothetical protein